MTMKRLSRSPTPAMKRLRDSRPPAPPGHVSPVALQLRQAVRAPAAARKRHTRWTPCISSLVPVEHAVGTRAYATSRLSRNAAGASRSPAHNALSSLASGMSVRGSSVILLLPRSHEVGREEHRDIERDPDAGQEVPVQCVVTHPREIPLLHLTAEHELGDRERLGR